jgi:hypothetical protein
MGAAVAAARRHRARIVGGSEGAALEASVAEWAVKNGVKSSARLIAMVAPWPT